MNYDCTGMSVVITLTTEARSVVETLEWLPRQAETITDFQDRVSRSVAGAVGGIMMWQQEQREEPPQ
jgi:hypothetical protein